MLYNLFQELNISYTEIEHQPVFTMDDLESVWENIEGVSCKNLFLKGGRNYYLYILEGSKRADTKMLAKLIHSSRLSFGSSSELKQILNLEPGSVSPFGIIYDKDVQVTIVIDSDLVSKTLLFHPNVNTKKVSIQYEDLLRFILFLNHSYILV